MAGAPKVVTKKLHIDVLGEIGGVYWTRSLDDENATTIQVNFVSVRQGRPQPPHPKTQVWLLKSDGTVIQPFAPANTGGVANAGAETEFVSYAYTHLAATDAVAVAVCIGDQFFIERLQDTK